MFKAYFFGLFIRIHRRGRHLLGTLYCGRKRFSAALSTARSEDFLYVDDIRRDLSAIIFGFPESHETY